MVFVTVDIKIQIKSKVQKLLEMFSTIISSALSQSDRSTVANKSWRMFFSPSRGCDRVAAERRGASATLRHMERVLNIN